MLETKSTIYSLEADPLPTDSDILWNADSFVERREIEEAAKELIANRSIISGEYKTTQTYSDDARTLLFEALTASGHLSRIELTGSLDEIHRNMLSVLLNAYNENLPLPERNRRFYELCNELSRQQIERKIADGQLGHEVQFAEISDFIEGLPGGQARDIGYRPSNRKGMVRSSWLLSNQDGSFTRVSEQISRSNADAVYSRNFLEANRVPLRLATSADQQVLGAGIIHEMSEGVVGLMKLLDSHKGQNIRYGESISSSQLSYDELREESAQRELQAECYVDRLAEFTRGLDIKLAHQKITSNEYQEILNEEIRTILRAICVMRPEYAKDCFGEAVEATYKHASDLAATGDTAGASAMVSAAKGLESAVTFCGGSIASENIAQTSTAIDSLGNLISLGLENWRWAPGVCRVDECPTRPGKTDVGPCSVCRGCQHQFDRGRNPAQVYKRMKKVAKLAGKSSKLGDDKKTKPEFKVFDFSKYKQDKQKTAKHEKMAA